MYQNLANFGEISPISCQNRSCQNRSRPLRKLEPPARKAALRGLSRRRRAPRASTKMMWRPFTSCRRRGARRDHPVTPVIRPRSRPPPACGFVCPSKATESGPSPLAVRSPSRSSAAPAGICLPISNHASVMVTFLTVAGLYRGKQCVRG